jgi:hypothetical protein
VAYVSGILTNPIKLVNKLQNTLSVDSTCRARDIYRREEVMMRREFEERFSTSEKEM